MFAVRSLSSQKPHAPVVQGQSIHPSTWEEEVRNERSERPPTPPALYQGRVPMESNTPNKRDQAHLAHTLSREQLAGAYMAATQARGLHDGAASIASPQQGARVHGEADDAQPQDGKHGLQSKDHLLQGSSFQRDSQQSENTDAQLSRQLQWSPSPQGVQGSQGTAAWLAHPAHMPPVPKQTDVASAAAMPTGTVAPPPDGGPAQRGDIGARHGSGGGSTAVPAWLAPWSPNGCNLCGGALDDPSHANGRCPCPSPEVRTCIKLHRLLLPVWNTDCCAQCCLDEYCHTHCYGNSFDAGALE